jgi:membrane protease YdiL (CAAX protease family)
MSRSTASAGDALQMDAPSPADIPGYLGRSARPLTSLVFLLPFIVLYELGTRFLLTDTVQGTQHIVAFTMLRRFFALFGASGRHLPALAVVAILLAWHIARKDGWSIKLGTLVGMIVESIALAVPLMVFAVVLARLLPLSAPTGESLGQTLVLSLGAGVYEELVFRLMLCTGLALVLHNGFRIKAGTTLLLVVVLSAFLFSAYHYLGNEAFNLRIFTFRMGAGVYFAALFVIRGFGVTAGSHMAYDMLIVIF